MKDYYTVQKEGDSYKLNINGYIGRNNYGTTAEQNKIKITLESVDQYMEYAVYHFRVKNDTNQGILLDSQESTNGVYAVNQNESKFRAFTDEMLKQDLAVKAGEEKNVPITFSHSYSSKVDINYITFSDIILDSEQYEKLEDVSQYQDRVKISVDL